MAKQWHAVSITSKTECCEAVQMFRGSRFLSRDAPSLPLTECKMANRCACVYRHHADRRGPARRKNEGFARNRNGPERRDSADRRSDDESAIGDRFDR